MNPPTLIIAQGVHLKHHLSSFAIIGWVGRVSEAQSLARNVVTLRSNVQGFESQVYGDQGSGLFTSSSRIPRSLRNLLEFDGLLWEPYIVISQNKDTPI